MTTLRFINNIIERLFLTFPDLEECFHEYNSTTGTHFIKIPGEVYDTRDFSLFDAEVTLELYKGNYEGVICFITEESYTELTSPTHHINYFNNDVIQKNLNLIFQDIGIPKDNHSVTVTNPRKSSELDESFDRGFEDENYALAA